MASHRIQVVLFFFFYWCWFFVILLYLFIYFVSYIITVHKWFFSFKKIFMPYSFQTNCAHAFNPCHECTEVWQALSSNHRLNWLTMWSFYIAINIILYPYPSAWGLSPSTRWGCSNNSLSTWRTLSESELDVPWELPLPYMRIHQHEKVIVLYWLHCWSYSVSWSI